MPDPRIGIHSLFAHNPGLFPTSEGLNPLMTIIPQGNVAHHGFALATKTNQEEVCFASQIRVSRPSSS